MNEKIPDEQYHGNTYEEFEKNMDDIEDIEVPEDFDPLERIE